ncbi:hypothetical protein [Piscinibacter terrae]|uniref:F5/8 type C domain-containing protein n=1 Tax=Piscinibacter terrae TaxID=2496871 RepID=A0A3N7HP34_9BURK|nr:hypothetical protein [Albitalea terrae]RQP23914.1 hypothetical protein DZC73_17545 [Albitalea terrae]
MKHLSLAALIVSTVALTACGKKHKEETAAAPAPTATAPAPAPTPAPAPADDPAAKSKEQREKESKQKALDFATMEDKYINDPRGQWASDAKASSSFSEDPKNPPEDGGKVKRVLGPVDNKVWTNNNQDIGFDWLETTYAKPVSATEVRIVFSHGNGVDAVTKLELQDTDGKWVTVWSGLSDQKEDNRGDRTWFVKTFDKTPYKVKAVKFTIANNVHTGYKEVDAVQLVGD